ncbi:MAG: class I SAM-dependent methyltransferase, partial [Actinomycetes bacterium]
MSSTDPVADFFSNWQTYRHVIDTNSMEHIEVFAAVHSILAKRTEPYTLLDLGCGDAAAIAPAMAGTPIHRYFGVDCAEGALDFARQTFAAHPVPQLQLRVGDLLREVETSDERFDVILVSFALHHFADDDKQRFLTAVRDKLTPGGELI